MAKHITLEERYKISKYKRLGLSERHIGRELGRSPTTIGRALTRYGNVVEGDQSAKEVEYRVHEEVHRNRVAASKSKIRLKSEEIRKYVEKKLELKWTPEVIAGRLTVEHPELSISDQAIYDWLEYERPDLRIYLPVIGKSRRRRVSKVSIKPRKVAAAPKVSIEYRPKGAKARTEIGHIEQDSMVSRQSKAVLINVVDRGTRMVFADLVPCKKSEVYGEAFVKLVQSHPTLKNHIKTASIDNGTENADWMKTDKILNIKTYFCHPYCSADKGTVENRNRKLRQMCCPKKTNFATLSKEALSKAVEDNNNTPMKVLKFYTPQEVWDMAVMNGGVIPEVVLQPR